MLVTGKKAPNFSLLDSNGKKISLKDFIGKKVVLYFYPKDMTPGCTKEACDFRDSYEKFKKYDMAVIGISPDTVSSHKKFMDKFNLPFLLLSDEKKSVLQKYGVWKEKNMYGKKYMGVERTTFLVDEKGMVMKIYNKVNVEGHVEDIISVLKQNK